VDRTLINIASIVLGGAGLLTVLTGFNVPETSSSFYGDNPFLIKREAIQTSMDWIFSGVAVLALLLQLWAEIMGLGLPDRRHTSTFYVMFAGASLVAVALIVWLLSKMGRSIARRSWLPRVIGPQRDLLGDAAAIVKNDGLSDQEMAVAAEYSGPRREERSEANFRQALQYVGQMERLFEVKPEGSLAKRVERLRNVLTIAGSSTEDVNVR
jgi:hypothetical protein